MSLVGEIEYALRTGLKVVDTDGIRQLGQSQTKPVFEDYGSTHEIIVIRTNMFAGSDFDPLPFIDTNGNIALAKHRYETELTVAGDRPKIVILDEFSSARPKVQAFFDGLIDQVIDSNADVLFVKVG